MEGKKSRVSSEKTGMTKSHSSTSSLSSIPRLPPIESGIAKTIAEVPNDQMRQKLSKVLEGGKRDIVLATESVVEQVRIAEQQITSRLDSLSQEIQNAVEREMKLKDSEISELRLRYEESDSRVASLLERERGLVEQQSQLSIELVLERRAKLNAQTELKSFNKQVEELKGKIDEFISNEKDKKTDEMKAKNDLSVKMKENKDECSNLKRQLEEERELRRKEKESIKLDSSDKHNKESMRLHQEVNKWKLKCEKCLDEIQSVKKETKAKEEELRRERVAQEEKYKYENGQHKSTLKMLEEKILFLTETQESDRASKGKTVEQMQSETEDLKSKYRDALKQIEHLKRSLEEYENPVEDVMENSRLRLLRAQNQREKARLESDRREAVRLKNILAANK